MLINIDLDVINSEEQFRLLDRLLMLFENDQHEWYLEDKLEDVMQCGWPSQLSNRHQNILKTIVEKSFSRSGWVTKPEKRDRGIVKITLEGESSLENVLKGIDGPLFIVVENETSDTLFLNRLFEIYPSHGKTLSKALESSFLEYYPAGGRNETIKTIKNISNKKKAPHVPRIFVFVDSDKKFPGQEHDSTLQEIVDFCSEQNIPIHILYKREIENYIPKEVLQKRIPAQLSRVTEEFFNLTADQWDFFDLEKGFNGQQPNNNDPLYSNYSTRRDQKYENLRKGFSGERAVFRPKQELYTFVQDEEFNAKNVNIRCAHQPDRDELLNLLLRIKNKL